MMQKEITTYTSGDYLHQQVLDNQDDTIMITESDRLIIVDWCYSVADTCKLDRETVAVAMEMVDRFLSKPSRLAYHVLHDRDQFQLLVITAMYLTIKTAQSVVHGCDFVASTSKGTYCMEDIEAMEINLLQGLSWHICAPTSMQMAHYILSLLLPHLDIEESMWALILDEIKYQTEHAVRDYNLSIYRQSTVAVAAIMISLEHIGKQDSTTILGFLRSVSDCLNEESIPETDLFSTKTRLLSVVERHDADEGRGNTDDSVFAS